MNNIKQKKVELLAPAGGMKQLIAAIENGADAIYIGGKKFNARMNANNFSIDEMKEAIIYAHTRNVKIFVTLNILLKDEELQEALEYVAELYQIGIDAVILQDIGLAYLINEHIPNMEMHFSTQGSIYNRTGVKNALKIGFKRIVLAREMSLEEIKSTTDLCDIEVFVHGAMCMCYSGQCQMSRFIGGRSGNRGECAQPCRLPYLNDRGEKKYLLSPKDMCMIDSLDELIEAGVTSLKIEGRMKSAEYVATVVRIYRKYIDEYYKYGTYKVSVEDREELLQAYNRGKFTTGYFYGYPKETILTEKSPKHQGIKIGKVIGKAKNKLIKVELEKALQIGDRIEIQGNEYVDNIVTYIEKQENKKYIIGDFKWNGRKGESIYKIISKELSEKAKENSKLYTRKNSINLNFKANIGEKPTLEMNTQGYSFIAQGENDFQKAIHKPLDKERIAQQLGKTGNTPFKIMKMHIDIEQGGTMPISEINELRRKCIEGLIDCMKNEKGKCAIKRIASNKLKFELNRDNIKDICIKEHSNVTKGNEDRFIELNLQKEQNVILNNLGWIEEYLSNDSKVFIGSGVNVSNWAAKEYLEKIGCIVLEGSQELKEEADILMTTEHRIDSSYIVDRKGKKYKIEISEYGDKYYVKR